MDQLIIKNLELFGFHGVNSEEKIMGQKFIIDATIALDLSKAGDSDSLETAINYAELCHKLQEEFKATKHNLIEKAATVLCEYILHHYPMVTEVDLTLKKPWAPIHLPIDYPAVRLVRKWHYVYIAVGSNLGDKQGNIHQAFTLINDSLHSSILQQSTLIETEPFGYTNQDTFINGVILIKTLLSPINLIRFLQSIEHTLKRERLIQWGPRTIDLDVIYYDNLVSDEEAIIIPHPRMHERDFVLKPLNEIAPNALHPLLRKRTYELLNALLS
jgi:dihydroneopterin aldolase / 2-amino-4-hydroxy-6-hydroxymethyldihydropteridine diphosphokinase